MIDSYKALGWLNAIDRRSRLSSEVRRLIGEIRRFPLDDVRVSLILERLRNAAQVASDPLEKAEILICCASIGGYQRTWSPQAARDAREAVILYDCDDHRRAVALWILGILQWEMFQNHQAHRNWLEAKYLFRKCQILFKDFPDEKAWYQTRMWEMDIEFIFRPEEIASWLNCFEGPSLRPKTQEIIRKVRRKTLQQSYSNIHALMEDLQEANRYSRGFHESAEIHLEFGLAVYQLRNPYAALEFLRKAVRNYYPGVGNYHKQAMARCMLGALEWMQQSTARQAFEDWDYCLDEFENLRWCADRDNDEKKERWYRYQRLVLRAALLERVRLADPSETAESFSRTSSPEPMPPAPPDNGDNTPGTSRPRTPPPAPETHRSGTHPGNTTSYDELYEELLVKVRRDRAIADRLIEYERKKAPNADPIEWVRRANERWIDDNR